MPRSLAQAVEQADDARDLGVDDSGGFALALAGAAEGADDPQLAQLAGQGEEVFAGFYLRRRCVSMICLQREQERAMGRGKPYQRLGLQVHVHAVEGRLPWVGAVRNARRGDQDEVAEALEDIGYYATLAIWGRVVSSELWR